MSPRNTYVRLGWRSLLLVVAFFLILGTMVATLLVVTRLGSDPVGVQKRAVKGQTHYAANFGRTHLRGQINLYRRRAALH